MDGRPEEFRSCSTLEARLAALRIADKKVLQALPTAPELAQKIREYKPFAELMKLQDSAEFAGLVEKQFREVLCEVETNVGRLFPTLFPDAKGFHMHDEDPNKLPDARLFSYLLNHCDGRWRQSADYVFYACKKHPCIAHAQGAI